MALRRGQLWIIFVLICLFCFAADVDASKKKSTPDGRLKSLVKRQNTTEPVLSISEKNFNRFVDNSPRLYNVFLLLSSTQKDLDCRYCKELQLHFEQIASHYWHLHAASYLNPKQQNFFMFIDGKDYRDLFHEIGIQSIPKVLFVPAVSEEDSKSVKSLLKNKKLMFDGSKEPLASFVERHAKVNLMLQGAQESSEPDYQFYSLLAVFSLLTLPFFWAFRKSPWLYFVLALALVVFCVGGGHYNAIREVPWFGMNRGGTRYIYPSTQMQYGLEGPMMAGLQVFLGLLIVAGSELIAGKWGSSLNGQVKFVLFLGLAWTAAVVFMQVQSVYRQKAPYYMRA